MAAITTRAGKGAPLTNAEMDANLINLNESQTVTGEPMGHVDATQSTISFNASTRTFTIAPVGANFVVWCKGEKYTFTTSQSVVIPNTGGLHYIYFDQYGVLSTRMSFFSLEEDAPTAYIYWNSTIGSAIYFADERHGVTLDWQTHEYLHRTRGAAIASGFAISEYTTSGDGTANADAQVTINGGTFFDEDIQIDVVSTNTPTAGTWQQDLSSPAQIPVLYLDGTQWKITTANDYPVKKNSLLQYNTLSGGVWSLTDINSGEFTVSWILATNNLNYPVLAVLNQSATNTLGQAEALQFEDLTLPGFPSLEFRPLYRLIFQGSNSYTNTPKARLRSVLDLRSISSAGVGPSLISDHGNLSGLTDDDHTQYLSVSTVRSGIDQDVKDSLIAHTPVAGGVAYGTSTSLNFSAAGTAGQILTSGGASVPTWTNSTSANTASAIVQRDANGDFTARIITADLSGNATTSTTAGTANALNTANDYTIKKLSASSSGASDTITVTDTGVNGANIKLVGDGATTPNKTMRSNGGNWQIVNSAYSAVIMTLTDSGNLSVAGTASDVAGNLRSLPINSQTAAYVVAATDNGKVISITTGGVTINNSVMSAGMVVTIYNNSGSSQTITQGTGVTLQWSGQAASTTGSRTLALYGMATILFLSASSAVITGSGLT